MSAKQNSPSQLETDYIRVQPVKKQRPLFSHKQYLFRYFPKYDEKTFLQQLEHTDRAIQEFYPKSASDQIDTFNKTVQAMQIGSILVTGLTCLVLHKLPLIKKLPPWPMYFLRLAVFIVPNKLVYQFLNNTFRHEFDREVYATIKRPYRRYKFSGNILTLNPAIYLQEI